MANRRRQQKEKLENGKTAAIVTKNGERKIVSAEQVAESARKGNINPKSFTFYCPGRGDDNKPCGCKLQLCSWHTGNKVSPYFAHRDGDATEHTKGCNCALEYTEVRIKKTVDYSFKNFDPLELLAKWMPNDEEQDEHPKGGGGGDAFPIPKYKKHSNGQADTEVEYVQVNNLNDMYSLIKLAKEADKGLKTDTEWTPRGLIIDCDTIEDYRTGRLPLRGPKLIVGSFTKIRREMVDSIAEGIANKPFVMRDPYIRLGSSVIMYYVLSFANEEIANAYRDKLYNMEKNGSTPLIFGRVMKLVYDKPKIKVCSVEIVDIKGRQVQGLKYSKEDEDKIQKWE